jgi:hypothetical protein
MSMQATSVRGEAIEPLGWGVAGAAEADGRVHPARSAAPAAALAPVIIRKARDPDVVRLLSPDPMWMV